MGEPSPRQRLAVFAADRSTKAPILTLRASMPPSSGGLAVLKNRDFSLYVSARFLSNIATQMLIVAVGWQVYHITGRVLDLGLIGLSQFLPFLCLVLFSGHIADQFDRRAIIIFGH